MPASYQLNIIIVGAGLGGLSAAIGLLKAGHKVCLLEQASEITEVGAGIRISPNSSRLLIRWGLQEKIEEKAVTPKAIILRRYENGQILCEEPIGSDVKDKYGSPYWLIHRTDYQRILLDKALEEGLELHLDAFVETIDFTIPAAVLKNGDVIRGDVILGADGIRSRVREAIIGHPDPPRNTGDMAYRILTPASEIRNKPELRELLGDGIHAPINFWIGPDCHVASYLLKGGELYNIVLLCPDKLPDEVTTELGDVDEINTIVEKWDPRLQLLFSTVKKCLKSKLQYSEVESWIHPEGKVALLGDACHASLPYLGQGAAMAVEDGAALGYLFEKCSKSEDVPVLLRIYENTRKARTTTVTQRAALNRKIFHIHDGPMQKARDKILLEEMPREGHPNQYADPIFQKWLWGYKVEEECERNWINYRVRNPVFLTDPLDAQLSFLANQCINVCIQSDPMLY